MRGPCLENLRRERDDLHELLGAQLAGHRPEDAGADRLAFLADHHGAVGVELDVAAVGPLQLALGAHDYGARDLALLHLAVDHRLLDGDDDHVADGRVPALGAAEHLDAGDLLRAGVVGHIEDRRHLDHVTWPSAFTWDSASALTRTSATRQRFSFDIGGVSTMRTLSPGFADWRSSWHLYCCFSVRYLPYWPCLARRSTCTTTVFIILLERTVPMRLLGRPRSTCPLCVFSVIAVPSLPRAARPAAAGAVSAPPCAAPCWRPSSA